MRVPLFIHREEFKTTNLGEILCSIAASPRLVMPGEIFSCRITNEEIYDKFNSERRKCSAQSKNPHSANTQTVTNIPYISWGNSFQGRKSPSLHLFLKYFAHFTLSDYSFYNNFESKTRILQQYKLSRQHRLLETKTAIYSSSVKTLTGSKQKTPRLSSNMNDYLQQLDHSVDEMFDRLSGDTKPTTSFAYDRACLLA